MVLCRTFPMSAGNGRDTDAAGHGVDTTGPSVSTLMVPPRDREAEARKEAGVGIGLLSVTLRRGFQLPTTSICRVAPRVMSVRRERPRHMTMFPGGGSLERAR